MAFFFFTFFSFLTYSVFLSLKCGPISSVLRSQSAAQAWWYSQVTRINPSGAQRPPELHIIIFRGSMLCWAGIQGLTYETRLLPFDLFSQPRINVNFTFHILHQKSKSRIVYFSFHFHLFNNVLQSILRYLNIGSGEKVQWLGCLPCI